MKRYYNRILAWLPVLLLCIMGGICLFPVRQICAQELNPMPDNVPALPLPEAQLVVPEAVPVISETEVMPDVPATEPVPVIIVLDPGHGGEGDEGAMYENFVEKEMNLVLANAMKTELEKYEGVTVYLTRTGDQNLTLAQRSEYAKSVNADMMFCLHFNTSGSHTLFGTECWISAFGEEYSKGRSFAEIEMQMLEELGLYSRGIKTRIGDKGTDYYGIIRTASELDLTCVLIEHCHIDHQNDRSFCEGREQWEAFGRLDATAVAKYFHLKSDILGVDYSDYPIPAVPVPDYVVSPDTTPPDVCIIDFVSQDMTNGEVAIQLSAADYDSGMLYYAYSYDGGETFSDLQPWNDKSQDTITFTMQVPPHILPQIMVKGYNGYDLATESNIISLPSMDYKTEEELAEEQAQKAAEESAAFDDLPADEEASPIETPAKKSVEVRRVSVTEENEPVSVGYFLSVCLVCALLVLGMALSAILILRSKKKRRRRKRKKS